MDTTMEPASNGYHAIEKFIESLTHIDTLDECFAGYTKISPEQDRITRETCQKKMIQLLKNTPITGIDGAIKFYVHKLNNVINHCQSEKMFRMLEDIIQADLVKPFIICQAILSEEFDLKNEVYWTNGLNFIRRIIHSVKYKEVRDILASLLYKIPLIPIKCSVSVYRQINAFYDLISLILDRNANLLPAYLVLDEIQTKFFVADHKGHWMFSRLFSVFVDSFRPVAKIISHAGRPQIMPIAGYCFSNNSLKLDENTAKFKLKSSLPYDKELFEPQTTLLLHIMEQNNSRDIIASVLSLSTASGSVQKKDVLETNRTLNIIEELLIELIFSAINRTCHIFKTSAGDETIENMDFSDQENYVAQVVAIWNHISTMALFFAFQYQSICLPIMLTGLLKKLINNDPSKPRKAPTVANMIKCREFFLWTLFQMLSWHSNIIPATAGNSTGTGQSQDSSEMIYLLNVIKLMEIMYPEKEPLPVPDCKKRNSVYIMVGSSLCIYLLKNKIENSKILQHFPIALRLHIDYIRTNAMVVTEDFATAIVCNAYTSNSEIYAKLYHTYFRENILDKGNNSKPISMDLLDSLTITTRKNLTDDIMNRFKAIVQNKSMPSFPCHLAETYCRLMTFTEIEMIETKTLGQLMITMLRNHCWNYLYNLLELYSYRLHRINCSNQIQLLRQLYCKSHIAQINHIQLYSFMENTALKILYGFNCYEFIAFCMRSKSGAETYNFLPPDSEELYKIFVYTLARAIHITGTETLSSDKYVTWVNDILKEIKNFNTNLTWPSFTLKCFPPIISEFYQSSNPRKEPNREERNQLTQLVDEEYRRWKSITNQSELVNYFTAQGNPPLIYCILYKMLLDGEPIPSVSYKILDKIGVRALSNHLRTFTDFLVLQFASLVGGNLVNKCRDAVNDLIWKCHIVTMDKLLLCLALRSFEGNEAQVCFFIIQSLVINNPEIKNRITEFTGTSPKHWRQSNWAEVQANFQKKYPEKYYFHHLQQEQEPVGGGGGGQNSQTAPPGSGTGTGSTIPTPAQTLIPSIFSNICLRLLPVFDVIMHRLIELPPYQNVSNFVVNLLDEYGCLYKFHSHPITFLYNTLHYYEKNLRERSTHKKKLVYTVVSAFNNIKPRNWAVTEPFLNYCQRPPPPPGSSDDDWNPGPDYYKFLIGRLVDTLSSSLEAKCPFPVADYRFNEFANVQSHALYATCVEILALPGKPIDTANHLINVVTSHHKSIPRADIELWINAIGLIFTALPESYSCVLKDRFIELLKNTEKIQGPDLYHLFDFKKSHGHFYETDISYVLALSHSYWNHGTVGQLCSMPQFIREKIKPIVQTEEQLMLVCYFVGPFLQRVHLERTRCVIDIATELFQMLDAIDKKCTKLNHIDTICDLFYHFKYRFIGTVLKKLFDEKIDTMRPEFQEKLRFFSQVSEDTT